VKKQLICAILLLVVLPSCGGADVDVKAMLTAHQAQLAQCYESKDAKLCDAAIATLESDIPLLKRACSSGNNQACGLFPGYDQVPQMLRSYKTMCIENQVDPSIPDNLREIVRQGMKAGCDKMKFTGPIQ
jgi:hypothetical protein